MFLLDNLPKYFGKFAMNDYSTLMLYLKIVLFSKLDQYYLYTKQLHNGFLRKSSYS